MVIKALNSIKGLVSQFSSLLIDCIESGASVGFLTPLDTTEILDYWQGVEAELVSGKRKLFAVFNENELVACVQLSLCSKANGQHRGEVEKLMVSTSSRGQGISKILMSYMEQNARESDLSLLVLDTRLGDVASSLYRAIGYIEAGHIPQFARSSNGELEGTVFFYKLLK
jgi:ribosomal protein S18 acetylase RimI-like enzyme